MTAATDVSAPTVPRHLAVLAIGGTSLLAAVSVAMNFSHAFAQGDTLFNAWAFGLAMAGADALKCTLPFLFAVALDRRHWLAVATIPPLFLLLTGFSLVSAIGFAAENRAGRIDGREAATARYQIVKAGHDANVTRRAEIAPHRSRAEVESSIVAALQSVPEGATSTVARMSADCTRPTPASRTPCAGVAQLREELARAVLADSLVNEIARARSELERLIANGALRDSDAQASAIARLIARFGADEKLVRSSLSWLIAIVIEAGSSIGLYVAGTALKRPSLQHVPGASPASAVRIAVDTPPPLAVAHWWLDRLHVARGAALTFHEAFDDYRAVAAARGASPLGYGDFRQGFDVIAGRVRVVVIGSQIQDVRLGAA